MNIFENKQLIFLEKDNKCPNSDACIDSARIFLGYRLNLPSEQIDKMILLYQFNLMDKEELTDILFNANNIIVTNSVYVQGSNQLFEYWMKSVGRNDLNGLIYIDSSGFLIDYLNRSLRNVEKGLFELICAINSNNIITIDYNIKSDEKNKPQLLKIDLTGVYNDCVKLIELSKNNVILPKLKKLVRK
jgi:hypothetical protein